MTETAHNAVLIQEFDGVRSFFDVAALQTRLIGCFIAAGRPDSSYMAEDIALAVEYTLRHAPRPEPVFGRGELDAAVIRTLEDTGFPDIARLFRQGGSESVIEVAATKPELAQLLRKYLACPEDRFEAVIDAVVAAAGKLDIASASPHLYLELARHFGRRALETAPQACLPTPGVTLTQAEIINLLPEKAATLCRAGVLRINGITPLFARIHFFFMMNRFAKVFQLRAPVTELEIEPLLYVAGAELEAARSAIEKRIAAPQPLPVILALPDMFDFITEYAGGTANGADKLAAELAEALVSGLNCELYKLAIG